MRCDHAHDDGAYVLGALSPAERSSYERHLAACPTCREAVAEIAVLPGLLGRLDPAAAMELLFDHEAGAARAPVGEGRVNTLIGAATQARRRERRTRRRRFAAVGLVAAALAAVVGLGTANLTGGPLDRPGATPGTGNATAVAPRLTAMKPVNGPVPVTAQIGLASRSWGTTVTMKCAYADTDNYARAWTFHLVAYGPDNAREEIGSWVAAPGDELPISSQTRFTGAQLVRLELTKGDGTPLLAYDVP
ncbi:MAG TPA: zf-HC2 domain-containing protein [Pilimelia sp.]|nr:zf-HC2 domain-containing protein [Pilimelia sp.]